MSLRTVGPCRRRILLSSRKSLVDLTRASTNLFHTATAGNGKGTNNPDLGTFYFVQSPELTRWPNHDLGVFETQTDPRFRYPGFSGAVAPSKAALDASRENERQHRQPHAKLYKTDLMTKPTLIENHVQVLYSANDFIKFTPNIEEEICSDTIEDFPELGGMDNVQCEIHEAPDLLKKDMQALFPDRDLRSGNFSVITLVQKTTNDMSVWSNEMEEEREKLTEQFVVAAKEIVARVKDEGYWADFLDPSSGTPYYGSHSSTTMFETDERYRLLGFRIEDLGCCKVIAHRNFGRNVFVGTLFTNVHKSTGVIEDLFEDLRIGLESSMSLDLTPPKQDL